MPLRHAIALMLLVVVPLIAIAWLGTSAIRRQREVRDANVRGLLTDRLQPIAAEAGQLRERYGSMLTERLGEAGRNTDQLRLLREDLPIVRSSLLVDRDGRLIYPSRPSEDQPRSLGWYLSLAELARTRPVSAGHEGSKTRPTNQTEGQARWQTWYHEGGLQVVLWQPFPDRTATGVVLERGRWIADLIAAMPDSEDVGAYSLRDGQDNVVYRWGRDREDSLALVSARMPEPWSAWRLTYANPALLQNSTLADAGPLIATLLATAIGVTLLGIYLMTGIRRQMRLASQRVSFAGHVSHELRTPLTNIRLYAELAKRDLSVNADEASVAKAEKRLDVIEEESRRLSRIVAGVMEMVTGNRPSSLNRRHQVPDDVVRVVLDGFKPALERRSIHTVVSLDAPNAVAIDEDILEIVLVNLLSNVEKYAGEGASVEVRTGQNDGETIIEVWDDGPGIPSSAAKRVFQPFVRLDDSLGAPAGTGLGLAIARAAARRHGGNLALLPSSTGCHFRFTLSTS